MDNDRALAEMLAELAARLEEQTRPRPAVERDRACHHRSTTDRSDASQNRMG